VKFFCDAMLGRLAKRLRILGYDTFYSPTVKDEELLNTDRVVITRDKELYERRIIRNLPAIFVSSEDVIDQVAEVLYAIGEREIKRRPVRCPECNGRLLPVDKEYVRGLVPTKVYERREVFWMCSSCGKVYRIGKHRLDMLEKIELMRRKLEELRRSK